MKIKLGLVSLSLLLLSGCATMSTVPATPGNGLAEHVPQADQRKMDIMFNTARDGTAQTWETDHASYRLVTNDTQVNQEGRPCRNYQLGIDKSIFSDTTINGVACRYNDQWKDSIG